VLFLDGFDTQAIMSRRSGKEWGLTKGALGPVFSAGLFDDRRAVFGPLADRVGRKKIIILSACVRCRRAGHRVCPGRQHAACDPV
jgi:AAHS family 4-hydroxybenzoate transporter-like MFS transporter